MKVDYDILGIGRLKDFLLSGKTIMRRGIMTVT